MSNEAHNLEPWTSHTIDSSWSFDALHTTIYRSIEAISTRHRYTFHIENQPSGTRRYVITHGRFGEIATIQLRHVLADKREIHVTYPQGQRVRDLLRGLSGEQKTDALKAYANRRALIQRIYDGFVRSFIAMFDDDTQWRDEIYEEEPQVSDRGKPTPEETNTHIDLDPRLVEAFAWYDTQKAAGNRVNLEDVAKRSGFSPSTAKKKNAKRKKSQNEPNSEPK